MSQQRKPTRKELQNRISELDRGWTKLYREREALQEQLATLTETCTRLGRELDESRADNETSIRAVGELNGQVRQMSAMIKELLPDAEGTLAMCRGHLLARIPKTDEYVARWEKHRDKQLDLVTRAEALTLPE